MDFGNAILRFRADNDLTQEKAAKLFGVTTATINRYELGKSQPSKARALRFCSIMQKYGMEAKE